MLDGSKILQSSGVGGLEPALLEYATHARALHCQRCWVAAALSLSALPSSLGKKCRKSTQDHTNDTHTASSSDKQTTRGSGKKTGRQQHHHTGGGENAMLFFDGPQQQECQSLTHLHLIRESAAPTKTKTACATRAPKQSDACNACRRHLLGSPCCWCCEWLPLSPPAKRRGAGWQLSGAWRPSMDALSAPCKGRHARTREQRCTRHHHEAGTRMLCKTWHCAHITS